MRPGFCVAALIGSLCGSSGAHAEAVCRARSFVTFDVAAPSPDAELARDIEQHLAAELAPRRLAICRRAGALAALRVRIERGAAEAESVTAHLEVSDAVTRKRLERSLELTRVAEDARAMAVASAVDELLRASWAELQVVDAPAVPAAEPALPRRTRKRELPAFELGVLGAFSMLSEREALGGDLFGALWLGSRTFAALRLGGAYGFPRSSEHGSARADDVHAALGGGFALVPREARFGVALELSAVALRVHFVATPNEEAFAASQPAWAALASLGARSWARVGPVRFTLGAAALRVLSPIRATDDGRAVVALEGFGAELTTGVALLVPGTGQ